MPHATVKDCLENKQKHSKFQRISAVPSIASGCRDNWPGLRWLRGLFDRPLLRIRDGQPLIIHPFEQVTLHEPLTETELQSYIPQKDN
jgi:hypothetical protein